MADTRRIKNGLFIWTSNGQACLDTFTDIIGEMKKTESGLDGIKAIKDAEMIYNEIKKITNSFIGCVDRFKQSVNFKQKRKEMK